MFAGWQFFSWPIGPIRARAYPVRDFTDPVWVLEAP